MDNIKNTKNIMIKYTIKNFLNKSYRYRVIAAKWHKRAVENDPIGEINRVYHSAFGRYPDLENPKNIIEKTFWLTLHSDLTEWSRCADKYAMREYVKECGLEQMLPKNLGRWEDANEIDFSKLPNKFVLKTNNASSTCIVVTDKTQLDINKARKKLNQWLSIPFGYSGYQPHYLAIPPCIIAEEFLEADEFQKTVSPSSLIDYKFYCCNGEPYYVWVPFNRRPQVEMNLFDLDWNSHSELLKETNENFIVDPIIPKPVCMDELIKAARILSKPFPQVRVDFFVIKDRPYIGELTFTSCYGIFTDELYDFLGSKVDLSNVKKIR